MLRQVLSCLALVGALLLPTLTHAANYADARLATPIADVTVTSSATLIAAAEDRLTISCTNTSATVNVRWGNSAVTASTGQQIRAGLAIQINNRDAIYMISEGANVTVSCTKEYK